MINTTVKLIAIVGPTASGKTDMSLALAEGFNGEIVCADSRTIYRGMDIGTAKPSAEEQLRVPHHLLDVVGPGEVLSAGVFKTLAEAAINGIWARGKVPFLVGGSGLYMDAVLFDYQFPGVVDVAGRARLQAMSDVELRELLLVQDPRAYERVDLANRRRVMRAIEMTGQVVSRANTMRSRTLVLGLGLNKEFVRPRIELRIKKMLSQGFIDEVYRIGEMYGWESEAMTATGYSDFRDVIMGTKTTEEATASMVKGHMALVKKQLTWFRRNPAIHWLNNLAEAEPLVQAFLYNRTHDKDATNPGSS